MRLYLVPYGLFNFQSDAIFFGNQTFQDELKIEGRYRIEKLSIEQL